MRRAIVILGMLVMASIVWAADRKLSGSGEWQSLNGEAIRGKWTVTLSQSGDRLDGELTLSGSNVFSGGAVAGTIDGSSIMLGVLAEGNKVASFSGKLDGETISGEWEAGLIKDHGVWFGTLAK